MPSVSFHLQVFDVMLDVFGVDWNLLEPQIFYWDFIFCFVKLEQVDFPNVPQVGSNQKFARLLVEKGETVNFLFICFFYPLNLKSYFLRSD